MAPPLVAAFTSSCLTEQQAPPRPERLLFIDGLRGLAILMVLGYHAWLHPVGRAIPLTVGGFRFDLTAPCHFGYLGVHLFLVLSGFCLTYPLAHGELRLDLRRFARRRTRRILPAYYTALFLFALLRAVMHHPPSRGDILAHLLLIHNLWPQWMGSINGSFWSLALEWQLYLVFPFLVGSFRRAGVARTLIAVLVINLTYRTWVWFTHDLSTLGQAYYWCYALPGRLFEFVLGMAAAVMLVRHPERLCPRGCLLGAVGCSLVGVVMVKAWSLYSPVSDLVWGLAFCLLLLYAGARNAAGAPLFTARPLTRLGAISYSLYLIHAPPLRLLAAALRPLALPPLLAWLLFEGVVAPLLIGCAWLFYRLVESRSLPPPREERPDLRVGRTTGALEDIRWRAGAGSLPGHSAREAAVLADHEVTPA